jgi:anti-sigma-K factor RskA
MMVHDDMHVLTGSYVLDALSDAEREDFERHLHHCPSCQAEIRGLRETAARLAMAKTARPPAQMEERVLAATYRTRQLPPLARDRFRRDHARSWRARLFTDRRTVARPARDPSADPRPDHRRVNGWGSSWVRAPRLVAAFAAASVVVAVGLGITQVSTQHQLNSVKASNAAITKVLDAPDARIETAHATVGGAVTVVASALQREAVVTTKGMPSLSASRVYQVWVMNSSGSDARSVGLVSATDQTGQLLASGVRAGDQIGITVEPSGGASHPTTTPIVTVPVTA